MARLNSHLGRRLGVAAAALVATVPTLAVEAGRAGAADPVTDPAAVQLFAPVSGQTVETVQDSKRKTYYHLLLGTAPGVTSVDLSYVKDGVEKPIASSVLPDAATHLVDYLWPATVTGTVRLQAVGHAGSVDGTPESATVTLSTTPSHFDFVRPNPSGAPLGVFVRRDGHAFTRASGITGRDVEPTADAPVLGGAVVPPSAYPAPTGTFLREEDGWTYRKPVDLTGNPGLTTGRAVIRVSDPVATGSSSAAVVTPLYVQTVGAVRSTTAPVPGSANRTITAKVTDQNGQPVVGAVVRLRGYANGSRTPVSQYAVSDAHDGLVSFTNAGAGFPAGFYVAYVDLDLNGVKGPREPGSQSVVGTVTYAAPGKSLYHNNARIPNAGGTVGDSLRGTKLAAARHYQWIDQNGQLSYTSRAVLRAGARRISQPAHLTWVNAHGAPFNPRWLGKGRFENRAWANLRRRPGLRNAEMTFQQNAARHVFVEWEVKDIKPFTSTAALNAAFANLATAAKRYYGSAWRSRVEVKMLSNLSGGPAFALRVLQVAHAHGFTTIYLARGAAARTQIPASAHAYVTYVRGAVGGLYATR